MTTAQFLADLLERNLGMLQMSLGDISDAELLTRPVPAANHVAWQLGHLVGAEHHLMTMAGATMPELPAGFKERYSKESAKIDDAGAFGKKDELLAALTRMRAGTAAYARTLSDADLQKPAPEMIRSMVPTLGLLLEMHCQHVAMHLGQIQVVRRKLGKPILF